MAYSVGMTSNPEENIPEPTAYQPPPDADHLQDDEPDAPETEEEA